MAKKNGNHKALEARRRKNRRQQNLLRAQGDQTAMPAAAAAVALADREETAPAAKGLLDTLKGLGKSRAKWRSMLWMRLLLCVLAPAIIVYCCQLITLQDSGAVFAWLATSTGAAWITYGALLGVLVLIFSVTDSLF